WEPIGPQQANPGPFYVVWRGENQQDLETHPRPWQLATIGIARFEATFPHVIPSGEPAGSPAMRGLGMFRAECIHCHAMNREGGHVGPDLNVPQSIVEYRPEAQIRAYIKDPRTFRYGNMPAHPNMTDTQLDDLVAYFRAMKDRKHDDGGAP
ncbi:MAG TPA: cytochrome c, partial [Labilithrix sp.]